MLPCGDVVEGVAISGCHILDDDGNPCSRRRIGWSGLAAEQIQVIDSEGR